MTHSSQGDGPQVPVWKMVCFGSGTEADRRNNRLFTAWCLAWAIAVVSATWVIKNVDGMPAVAVWLLALAPTLLAAGAVMAYLHLLRMTDELQRKIHLEGLAVGFGAGWVFSIGYLVLEAAGAPPLSITGMVLVLSGGWMLGTIMAIRHYQ